MRKTIIILALLSLVCLACSGKATKKVDNPGVIYVEGVELLKKKKYDQAIEKFSAVRDNYPFDPIADVAMVKLGDTYYEKKEYLFASGVYTDFLNQHPDDENVPYVLWRLAQCFENLGLTSDRDQTYTLKAIERLTYLKNRYPTSQYSKGADELLAKFTQKLADRELYVGEFYYKTFQYNACVMRLEYLLNKYPGAKDLDKALSILAAAYGKLENPEKARLYTEKLRQEYPNSIYTKALAKEMAAAKTPGEKQPASFSLRADKKQPQVAPKSAPLSAGGSAAGAEAAGKGIDFGAKPREGADKTAVASRVEREPLALPSAEEEKSRRKIVLKPPDPTKDPTGEEQATPARVAQTKKSEVPREEAAKNDDKEKAFGFFKEKKPVDVVADMMEGLEKGKIIVFKGNVVTKQDDLQIFSDTLTAYLNEENDQIDRALAKGNVKILKGERTATCEEALFENGKGEITLKGNVVVYSGTDKLAGDTVKYYINEERVVVEGEKDKRARITVHPKK